MKRRKFKEMAWDRLKKDVFWGWQLGFVLGLETERIKDSMTEEDKRR